MAPVKTLAGSQLLVQVGDGASPEVFSADCLINTDRGIQFQSETNRQTVPDCDAPDTPGWSELTVDGLSATITGSGMLHTTSVPDWDEWFRSGASRNVRVKLNGVVKANGGGSWTAPFKLTGWEVSGTRKEKSTASITLESDGVVTWTDAAA